MIKVYNKYNTPLGTYVRKISPKHQPINVVGMSDQGVRISYVGREIHGPYWFNWRYFNNTFRIQRYF